MRALLKIHKTFLYSLYPCIHHACFPYIMLVLKNRQDIFFFCSIQKIKSNCSIVFLNFFQSSFLVENLFLSSCIHLYIKGSIFVIFCRSFSISSWFSANWDSALRAFIIFSIDRFLIQSGELILIHHDSHLFYDIYNTLNKHTWRQIQYL